MMEKAQGGRAGERGVALIITLLVTAVIVSVLAEIVFSVQMDTTASAGYADYENASALSRDGVGLARLVSRGINDQGYTYFGGETRHVETIKNGDAVLEIDLADESGRLSLNAIVYKNGKLNEVYYNMYVRLLDELGLPVSLAETLADWIDADDSPRRDGAENADYYERLDPPYRSAGRPLSSVGELYLVKGYGREEVKRLRPFVTVYTDGKININTAPVEVLEALSPDITADLAANVVSYRKGAPFEQTSEIRKVSGFEQLGFNLQSRIIVKSSIFRARLTARLGRARSLAEAVFREDEKASATLYYRQR
jgi:general secretion pathway protein K